MTNQITAAQLEELRTLLVERQDRGGFYYKYFLLTGSEQSLIQGHITTYSGFIGGAAQVGNSIAKLSNPDKYTITLDHFSYLIAKGLLDAVEADIQGGGTGFLTPTQIMDVDRAVWNSLDMGEYFPGNVQMWHIGVENLFSAGTFSSLLAGLQVTMGSLVGNTAEKFQGPQYRIDTSNPDCTVIWETVTDPSTGQPIEIIRHLEEKMGILDRMTMGAHAEPAFGLADEALLGLAAMSKAPVPALLLGGALLSNDATRSVAAGTFKMLFGSIFNDAAIDDDLALKFRRYLGSDGEPVDANPVYPEEVMWNQLPIVLRQGGSFSDEAGKSNFLIGYDSAVINGIDGDDVLVGFESSTLNAGNGYNFLLGTDTSTLTGGSGTDFLAAAGSSNVNGAGGSDVMLAVQTAQAHGGAGNDWGFAYDRAEIYGDAGDDTLIGYGAVRLDGGADNDLLLLYNPASSGQRATIDGGSGHDKVVSFGSADIYLGDGNDTVLYAGSGSVIYGGAGSDRVLFGENVLFADADGEDSVSFLETVLTGGLRWMYSESPYASGLMGLFRYGRNTEGDLIIRDFLGREMFVSDYQVSGFGGSYDSAGIHVLNYDMDAQRLLDLDMMPGYSWIGAFEFAFGHLMKSMTGTSLWGSVDPLVLDLDGDGIELISESYVGPMFDMDGDGFLERTGWVRGDDGILVMDHNSNGRIDDVSEMFGGPGSSGFSELAALDTNADGVIDGNDVGYSGLRVWRDLNGDAKTDAGEIFTLGAVGVASISLANTAAANSWNAGNQIMAVGTFTRTDGTSGSVADVAFRVDNVNSQWSGTVAISSEIKARANIKGHGTLVDLHQAMALDSAMVAAYDAAIGSVGSLDLATLRHAALPILSAWAAASPVVGGAPSVQHNDIPILVREANGEAQVFDFAYKTQAGHWALASGASVRDALGNIIAAPTYAEVMAQTVAGGASWQVFEGPMLAFLERYTGESIPLDQVPANPSAMLAGMTEALNTLWTAANHIAVRLAVQGALKDFFPGLEYDVSADGFVTTNPRGLAQTYEAIFTAVGAQGGDIAGNLARWEQFLKVVLHDFDRGGDHLMVTYSYLFANVVAAYETVGLPIGIKDAAAALGVPSEIVVAGGATLAGTAEADIIYLNAGNQVANGGAGADAYVVGRGFGSDVINDVEAYGTNRAPDLVRFADIRSDEVVASREGLDLILRVVGTSDVLRITRQFEGITPSMTGEDFSEQTGVDQIIFSDGVVWESLDIAYAVSHPAATSDTIIGTAVTDVMDGGAGNDILSGGDDSDIYKFGRGYGQDTIDERQTNILIGQDDWLVFNDVNQDDLKFERAGTGNDVRIRIVGTQDSITIKDQFSASYVPFFGPQRLNQVEGFLFADGSGISADEVAQNILQSEKTEGNDTISGFDRDDIIDGGAGNDLLSGGNDSDTYIIGFGYGSDTIWDRQTNILSGGTDTIKFTQGIRPQDVSVSRDRGSKDLVLTLSDGTVVTVKGQFDPLYTGVFGAQHLDRVERFEFADGTVWTSDQVAERLLQGTAGNDTIQGYSGSNDYLDGGAGNDFLSGGNDNDTYVFGLGYGHDIIDDQRTALLSGDKDTVKIKPGVSPSEVMFARPVGTNDLVMTLSDGSTLSILGMFGSDVGMIEEIYFEQTQTALTYEQICAHLLAAGRTAADDTIEGFSGDDRLDGGMGDDVLKGGSGNDTYVIGNGGSDTIIDTSGGRDVVEIAPGILPSQVQVRRGVALGDMQLVLPDGEIATVVSQNPMVRGSPTSIEEVKFSDGTVWSANKLRDLLLAGERTSGDDVIRGFSTDDKLDGGAGNDRLIGGSGNDTYVFGLGSGQDRIVDDGSNGWADTVVFGPGISAENIEVSRSGNHLVIVVVGTTDSLTIENHFGGIQAVERYRFANGAMISWQELEALAMLGSSGSDSIVGGGGNDIIRGGGGDDTLSGGSGADRYIYNLGDDDDIIIEGMDSATDTLVFGEGISRNDLSFSRSLTVPADIIVTVAGGGTILLKDQLGGYGKGVEQFQLSDGTTFTRVDVSQAAGVTLNTINGTSAAETSNGSGGDDVFNSSAGADTLRGSYGHDTYRVAAGGGNDVIDEYGYASDVDVVEMVGLLPSQVSISRSDTHLLLTLNATGEVVRVYDHFKGGTAGIEYIRFSDGTQLDHLAIARLTAQNGTSGNDAITGTNFQDLIRGGSGDDTLQGGKGSDRYDYFRGDGQDTIYEANEASPDTLILNGIRIDEVALERYGRDLKIVVGPGTQDSIYIKEQFYGTFPLGIEAFVFADGITLNSMQIQQRIMDANSTDGVDTLLGFDTADTLRARKGNDTITGGRGDDSYVYARGDGDDVIVEVADTASDRLVLEGIDSDQVSLLRSGNDVSILVSASSAGAGDAGTILIDEGLGSDGEGVEAVEFADGTIWTRADMQRMLLSQAITSGNDVITGFGGQDSLRGGAGNDTLAGYKGNDTYSYGYGDGFDTINESWAQGSQDLLIFENLASSNFRVSRNGLDVSLSLVNAIGEGQPGGVLLKNQFGGSEMGVETISFSDGTSWNLEALKQRYLDDATTAGNDSILGFDGRNDEIRGGAGDDILEGLSGRDRLDGGLGNDRLFGGDDDDILYGAAGDDRLQGGAGVDFYDGGDGYDTVDLSVGGTGWSVDLRRGIASSGSTVEQLVSIEAAIGGTGNDEFKGTAGNNRFEGGSGADTYHFGIGQGNDTIVDDGASGNIDRLILDGTVTPQSIKLYRESSHFNDLVIELSSGERLLIEGHFASTSRGIDSVIFSDGTTYDRNALAARLVMVGTPGADSITGTTSADVIDAGKGSDTLNGGNGSDRYIFRAGDGSDTIAENGAAGDVDRIVLKDILPGQIVVTRDISDVNDLILQMGQDLIRIDNQFSSTNAGIEEVEFADGTVWNRTALHAIARMRGTVAADVINGTAGDDLIQGNAGADTLRGGSGSDTYYFSTGDGQDVIDEYGTASNMDQIIFNDVTADQVTVSRDLVNNNNMTIHYGTAGDSVLLDQQYSGSVYSIEQVKFADGTIWDKNALHAAARMRGTSGNDTINGTTSDDAIEGGAGADLLKGGAGSDVYHFAFGAGQDRIVDGGNSANTDTIVFKSGIVPADVTMYRDPSNANHLVIEYGVAGDRIVVEGHFTGTASGVEVISFADGTQWDRTAIQNLLWTGGSATADTLTGTAAADRIFGGAGNDFLSGGDGDDLLQGGTGNDSIQVGAGVDTIWFDRNDGADTVAGLNSSQGLDRLLFGPQTSKGDLWFSKNGDDLLVQIVGTSDSVRLSSWYSQPSARMSIQTAGATLVEAQLAQLVDAMATFSAGNGGNLPASSAQMNSSIQLAISGAWTP